MRAVPLAGVVACVLAILPAADSAAEEDNCRNFSWSMGRTIDLFDEPLPTVQNSQGLPKEGAFALVLKPTSEVIYLVPPERGSDSGLGGIVTIESIPAGRYQIALSDGAWVDAIQGNAHLPALVPSRTKVCPGVMRSVEVEVKSEPLILQIGGAHVQRINIAVVRVWPFEWRW